MLFQYFRMEYKRDEEMMWKEVQCEREDETDKVAIVEVKLEVYFVKSYLKTCLSSGEAKTT